MSAWTKCRECGIKLTRATDDDDRGFCVFHLDTSEDNLTPNTTIDSNDGTCKYCGEGFGMESIVGNETGVWHERCPKTTPSDSNDGIEVTTCYEGGKPKKTKYSVDGGETFHATVAEALQAQTPTPIDSNEIDEILELYREYVADNITGRGGSDQIDEKEAKAKLSKYIAGEVVKARIDELEKILPYLNDWAIENYYKDRIQAIKQKEGRDE